MFPRARNEPYKLPHGYGIWLTIAVIRTSKNLESAEEFVNFLKGEEAHKIFQKWGWK